MPGNPFPYRCYKQFPEDLTKYITDSPGQFIQKLKNKGPIKFMQSNSLYVKTVQAVRLLELISSTPQPVGSEQYIVNDSTIKSIKQYKNEINKSRTVQALNNGQSYSSLFIRLYLHTLKSPYRLHKLLTYLLVFIDNIADLLATLKMQKILFLIILPLMKQLISFSIRLLKRFRF